MSASPHNANPGLNSETPELAASAKPAFVSAVDVPAPSHEALQALLAFSSLHEQIRQRRVREAHSGVASDPTDVWELEQFVLDEVLQLVAERALAITGADGIAIALAEGDAIICRASAGKIAPDAGVRLDPNSGFSGACLRSGRIIRCDDVENDPRVNVQACRRLGTRSMVAVPLAGQRSVIGLLEAFSSAAYGFNDSDVRSLSLLAELILAAMKPEEEDRLAEISERVVAAEKVEAKESTENSAREVELNVQSELQRARAKSEAVASSERTSSTSPSAGTSEPDNSPAIFSALGKTERSRPGIAVVLLVLLAAVVLTVGLWWKIRHHSQLPVAPPRQSVSQPSPVESKPAESQTEDVQTDATEASSSSPEKPGTLPRVTGIRQSSATDSSTVIVDMQDQVQYEAHRLANPERIYVDLHNTGLASGLFGKTIEVKDSLLTRVRIAQPRRGVTRIVLETNGPSDFSVRLESSPYRLVVEVHGPRPNKPAKAQSTIQTRTKVEGVAPVIAPKPAQLASPAESASPVDRQIRAALPKFRIVLDAGHGGWDLGTVGRKGLLEKDLVLDIVQRLGNLIQGRLGAEVIYTRQDDSYVALEKRAEIANLSQANLFVSVHANYSEDSSARGAETYYTNTYSSVRARPRETDPADKAAQNVDWTNVDIREKVQESRQVAASVQRSLYAMIAQKIPGIRNRGIKKASYVVLTGTSMPAILAEVSFVSSPGDESKLKSSEYRQQIAEALYKGIAHYAAAAHRVDMASASRKPAGE
jgi:N-acetylmuramoyl-L-alanine amidase/putative methionine-R-sulfoxide reductase with GAF domain